MVYAEQGRYAEAEPLYQRALHISERLGPENPDVIMTLHNLAELYRIQGKDAEAEPLFRRVLQMREQQLGPDHPYVSYPLIGLADLYREQGRYEEAEPLYLRALCIREQSLGSEHPEVTYVLNGQAASIDSGAGMKRPSHFTCGRCVSESNKREYHIPKRLIPCMARPSCGRHKGTARRPGPGIPVRWQCVSRHWEDTTRKQQR